MVIKLATPDTAAASNILEKYTSVLRLANILEAARALAQNEFIASLFYGETTAATLTNLNFERHINNAGDNVRRLEALTPLQRGSVALNSDVHDKAST